jgi:uncharacterized protein YukE
MSFTGMDIAAVRQLATQMHSSAAEIRNLSGQITHQVQATNWIGPDREHFVSEWTGTHVAQLHQVVAALEDAAQRANNNAQEQENASNSG